MGGTVGWLSDDEMRTWLAVIESHKVLFDVLDRDLREQHELTLDDYELLAHVSQAPEGRLRMTELASRVMMPKSRITYRVDHLESRGLLMREPCDDDRRGVRAVLTDDGRELLARAAPTHVLGVRSHLLEVISREERAVVGDALARVRDRLRSLPG